MAIKGSLTTHRASEGRLSRTQIADMAVNGAMIAPRPPPSACTHLPSSPFGSMAVATAIFSSLCGKRSWASRLINGVF
ncbi:hypothetical protein K523DRAFT_326259 [Schizophyllum commune Tattone D]|nr:hypothetical protein K523DRAFT_326259 [Schizophyllum commune Tattone D]